MAQAKQSIWIQARDLQILHGDNPQHWTWEYQPLIRQEVATLKNDTVLDIVGKIDPDGVFPESAAFLVFKLKENHKNIDEVYAYVGPAGTPSKGHTVSLVTDAHRRPDGWLEVKLGDIFANPKDGVGIPGQLEAHLWGIDAVKPKSGLVVRAIQVIPENIRN